jgi:hypothetical protein
LHLWLAQELARRDPSLVGFWTLGGPNPYVDHSGNWNHASPSGSCRAHLGGRPCYGEDPSLVTSSYLNCGHTPAIGFGVDEPFSVSCWVWLEDNYSSNQALISKVTHSPEKRGWFLSMDSDGDVGLSLVHNATLNMQSRAETPLSSSLAPRTRSWRHVVATYDGSTSVSGVGLYVDGKPRAPVISQDALSASGIGNSAYDLNIGRLYDLVLPVSAAGGISMVRLYSRALRSTEVAGLHRRDGRAFWAHDEALVGSGALAGASLGSGDLSLFLSGSSWASGSLDLYVDCDATASGSLNLAVLVDDPTGASGALPLFMHGSTDSGVFAACDLYVECGDDGNDASGILPLFLSGPSSASATGALNLALEGAYPTAGNELPLYLAGPDGAASGLALFLQGSGELDGGLPFDSYLNLVLWDWPSDSLPLFLQGQGETAESGLPLYLPGHATAASGLDLSLPQVLGESASGLSLYVCGY